MSNWPATKPRRVLAALEHIGWRVKRLPFHDNDELGRKILSRVAKHTGLRPEDL